MESVATKATGARTEQASRRIWRASDARSEALAEAERQAWRSSPAGYFPALLVGHDELGERPIEVLTGYADERGEWIAGLASQFAEGVERPDIRPLGDVEFAAPAAEPSAVRSVEPKKGQMVMPWLER